MEIEFMKIKEELDKINKKLDSFDKRLSKFEGILQSPKKSFDKKLSVKEFLLSLKTDGDVQKTLAIGYYLENYKELRIFNRKDLESAFREAKEGIPSNTNDKVNQSIKKGHMMEADEKKDNLKAWSLTNTGEKFVESSFKDE